MHIYEYTLSVLDTVLFEKKITFGIPVFILNSVLSIEPRANELSCSTVRDNCEQLMF